MASGEQFKISISNGSDKLEVSKRRVPGRVGHGKLDGEELMGEELEACNSI